MSEREHGFETKSLHAGQKADPVTGATALPIYQTAAYQFKDTEHAAKLFSLEQSGNIYTRIMNPTQEAFEACMASLEGGVGALALASGQAAAAYSILNLAGTGDEIVASPSLYGGTYTLFSQTLPRLGVHVRWADSDDLDSFRKVINVKTKAVFVEMIGNPKMDIPDIEMIAAMAHQHGVPLIVDSTFTTPYLCRPIEHGADIVVHSATKFIGGHGTAIGGVIIDSGKFNWDNGRYPEFAEPNPQRGKSYTEAFGPMAYIIKARVEQLSNLGAAISPFNAFLFVQGLATLALRMQRHCENALKVAQFLRGHPKVEWVNYPGLGDSPYYHLVGKYLPKGQGAILTFGVKGGCGTEKKVIDRINLISHAANVGDVKSLIIHPATTTHQKLSPEEQIKAGVSPGMLRLSVGLESVEDIMDDLDQALKGISV
ncbi:O-acetylhomoserine aminocarboxypropyltransferase/cysteine synthase [Cohnella pontilimi]|uniref:O-acetylhomoserine aminocarboxypropyltransferase/cysteine synthase n=1 Tax=Cohnella pontilimi TaxID=2564100 RepID=A0A4U0F5P5_9BACL|nr:O-acetylhomoserine aminocarboxypropyltransferase/cysteine synthase family protein [Cohnella pontilimi]TJY39578.1 O-acetylhomoserine aminocarboxypropyltransferase/cysteine synthase [Cohnella pontilimi]